jgi:hypothetical protein
MSNKVGNITGKIYKRTGNIEKGGWDIVRWIKLSYGGCYESGNESSAFVAGGGFLEQMNYYKLLKCGCAPKYTNLFVRYEVITGKLLTACL